MECKKLKGGKREWQTASSAEPYSSVYIYPFISYSSHYSIILPRGLSIVCIYTLKVGKTRSGESEWWNLNSIRNRPANSLSLPLSTFFFLFFYSLANQQMRSLVKNYSSISLMPTQLCFSSFAEENKFPFVANIFLIFTQNFNKKHFTLTMRALQN